MLLLFGTSIWVKQNLYMAPPVHVFFFTWTFTCKFLPFGIIKHLQVRVLESIGVTTVERLDQGNLHPRAPRVKHVSSGNQTWVACVAGEHSSKELLEQFILLLFGTSTYVDWNLCSTKYCSIHDKRTVWYSIPHTRCVRKQMRRVSELKNSTN